MKTVDQMITELSGRRNKSCYKVLSCAVKIALTYAPQEPQMKVIEAETAKKLMMENPRTVAKALSRAVEDIWDYGNREKLSRVYSRPVKERPTPKELIYRIVERIRTGVEYRVYTDPATGEYGICGHEDCGDDYAAVHPYTMDYEKLARLVRYLNKTQTPLDSFAECFFESGILKPARYRENTCFYDMKPNEIQLAIEEMMRELEEEKQR